MKKTALYLLLFTVIIATGCKNKKELLNEAERCADDSDYKKGILICNEVLMEDSASEQAWIIRGVCLEGLKDYKAASESYGTAIHFNKKGWRGHTLRAFLLCKQQHYEYSLPDFQAALDNASTDSARVRILLGRAAAYMSLRKFENARDDATEVLKYNPRNTDAICLIANSFSESKKEPNAIALYKKAIEIDSNCKTAYVDLAFVYSKTGEHQKAIGMNDKIISKYPDEPYPYNNRGYSKMQLNDFDGAMADINRSIQLAPGNSYAFRNRGLLYLKLKKNDEACADFQNALKLDFTRYFGNEVEELVKQHCTK